MWNDFKSFIMRGNVIDMAIGVIMGAAFGGIVNSLVNDIIMPPIGLLLQGKDFSNWVFSNAPFGQAFASLADAQKAHAVTINYGLFFNTVINFLIVSAAVFALVRVVSRLKPAPAKDTPSTKDCPYCLSIIHINATRCPNCTSDLHK
jgi:large conductance mechanosensitive channel